MAGNSWHLIFWRLFVWRPPFDRFAFFFLLGRVAFFKGAGIDFLRSCALQEMIFCQGLVSDAPLECNQTCNIHVTISSIHHPIYLPCKEAKFIKIHFPWRFISWCCSKGPRVRCLNFVCFGHRRIGKTIPTTDVTDKTASRRGLSQKKRRRKRAS